MIMDEKTNQEMTSVYFNDIINRSMRPVKASDIDPALLVQFDAAVVEAFPDDSEAAKHRLAYLKPYILNAIDWSAYRLPLEGWQMSYYYQRERFLEVTGLRYKDFTDHRMLMQAVDELGLYPEPTFEFILFLKYYYSLRSELRYSPLEMVKQIREALNGPAESVEMDIKVNNRHFRIRNRDFLAALFDSVDSSRISADRFASDFSEGANREKIRALDYYMVKTLLDYLPARVGNRRGRYTQAERNFSLCVLNFCGRLVGDDVEGICSHENNVTFDKLMRDFRDAPIPFAMELFL